MSHTVHYRRPFEPRPRFRKVVVTLALLAGLAGVSRSFALDGLDDKKEQLKDNGEEREKNKREDREKDRSKPRPKWRMIGHDPANTRNQPFEHGIKPANVSRLALKWAATTTGDVSATPAVVNGAVYFGDFGGTVWKLDAETGAVIWSHKVPDYTGNAGDYARTSPSLAGNTLVVGVIKGSTAVPGPNMLGIDATTGTLRWKTQIHPDSHAAMTGSPVLVGDTVITGISANGAGGDRRHLPRRDRRSQCPDGRHPVADLLASGQRRPSQGLRRRDDVLAARSRRCERARASARSGRRTRKPASVDACNAAVPGGFDESCEQPGAYWKSIVAFDLKTGEPRWSYRVQGHNPWMRACGSQPPTVTWCPAESDGEKWDMGGSGANVMRLKIHGRWRDVVGIGEKSGVYLLLDAKTGKFIWNTLIGPGGDQGGMEWGTAFDGHRIYASITNHHHIPYELTQNGVISNTTATGGSWAALDPETGKILWQTADPGLITLTGPTPPGAGTSVRGPSLR